MSKILVAMGGGEIKSKTTLKMDEFVANEAKARAALQGRRANGLFMGTASHDSMPYFNSFRKIYTSVYDIKAEVGLSVYGEMTADKIKDKIAAADFVYVGGGDTLFLLNHWKEKGIADMMIDAYNGGKLITGLSAGAVCWFEKAYSDYDIKPGEVGEYKILEGLGLIKGVMCPHYDERPEFDEVAKQFPLCYAAENDAAIVFEDGVAVKSLSSGGRAFVFENGVRRQL